jgi:hypothetical protein
MLDSNPEPNHTIRQEGGRILDKRREEILEGGSRTGVCDTKAEESWQNI